jgi:hypothetical protein
MEKYEAFAKEHGYIIKPFSLAKIIKKKDYLKLFEYINTLTKLWEKKDNIIFYSSDKETYQFYSNMIKNVDNNIDIEKYIKTAIKNIYNNDEYDNKVIFIRKGKERGHHIVCKIKLNNLNDLNDFKNALKYKPDDLCCICYEKNDKPTIGCSICTSIMCCDCFEKYNKSEFSHVCPVCQQ